ncbi:protein phosphatase 1 regulatory inhibitor subunit 16B [Apiospora marii]|uniref:protein phosphatase 1 regulatory inhibitor subunit 16B n=1 Tax=Apiospora marii TaxID=335849 RepID=UPI00313191DA
MAKTESKPTGAGKCGRPPNSAYLELMKEDEDWRQLEDASERRKIQNRLAQRAYRRNLRSRNKEVEALREQLMRFREADGNRTDTIESSSNSNSSRKSQPSSSRGSPKATDVQKTQPNEWMPSGYENHQFFDNYQDSDDSISFASGSSPGPHSPQSGETDLDIQIIYDEHTSLSPPPSAYNNVFPYEKECNSSGEDPPLPMQPSYHTFDYESGTTNHQHLAPISHHPTPRYGTPIELSHPATMGSDEDESRFYYGYPTNMCTEPRGPLVSITDFPAPAPGIHNHDIHAGERSRNHTIPRDTVNIHPALLYGASPPPQGTTPGSQQSIWPNMNDCTVTSLLHTAVAGGYMETVRLILDHWPELAHVVDAEGYTAVQRAIMSGRDDLISMFVH